MSRIISVHSFRGGTGKSNTAASVAALLAAEGQRVGVVDTDIQSPGIHTLFGLHQEAMRYSLNQYLWGTCDITQTAHDMTASLDAGLRGRVYLVPSSMKANDIARVMRDGYDVGLLNEGFRQLVKELSLDVLMLDTHPGLNEETLLSIAMSSTLAIVLRSTRTRTPEAISTSISSGPTTFDTVPSRPPPVTILSPRLSASIITR